MQSKTREVDGVQMRWLERGTGMPVVLIHGIPTSPALWRRVAPRLEGCKVLAWEMVGYGESIPQGIGRDISVAGQADYLRAFLAAEGIARAVLVGHDLGGGVAQIAAVREPARCAGLVLTNSIGYDSWPIPSVRALQAGRQVLTRLPKPMLKALLAPLIYRGHDDMQRARESLQVHYGPYARHDGTAALARQVAALRTRDTRQVEARIPELRGIPARVVWGAADPFQKLAYGERFARDLDCPLRSILGGKHFVPEDHPEDIITAIDEVLAALGDQVQPPLQAHA